MSLNKKDENYVRRKIVSLCAKRTRLKRILRGFYSKTDQELVAIENELEITEKQIEILTEENKIISKPAKIYTEVTQLPFGTHNNIGFINQPNDTKNSRN